MVVNSSVSGLLRCVDDHMAHLQLAAQLTQKFDQFLSIEVAVVDIELNALE